MICKVMNAVGLVSMTDVYRQNDTANVCLPIQVQKYK